MSFHGTHLSYWVYILASKPHGTLYIGVTNSLERRTWQHKTAMIEGFTKRYGVKRLVHFEEFRDVSNAIAREKQIKGWLRPKKVALIQKENPLGKDLAEEWYHVPVDSSLRSE
jgi:putative endonuclease